MSKYGVTSGPYLPVFGPETTPYLDTFHAVWRVPEKTIFSYIHLYILTHTHTHTHTHTLSKKLSASAFINLFT